MTLYRVKILIGVILVLVHRCHMAGHLVPLAVVVVGHHRHVVQPRVQRRHVVSLLYHLVAGADSCGQQKA